MNREEQQDKRDAAGATQHHFGPLPEPDQSETEVPRNSALLKPKRLAKKQPAGEGQRSQGRGTRGYVGGMTEMQARFVEEYLIDMNAWQAAIRSGYAAHTAHVVGNRLRNANKLVKAAIDARIDEA